VPDDTKMPSWSTPSGHTQVKPKLERESSNTNNMADEGVASFRLPASPGRSPAGADNMSVWVEDAGGEQRVHVALHGEPQPPATPAAPASQVEQPAADFPLILCDAGARGAASSAIVPFQKLQLDTNLNQTLLPYRSTEAPFPSGPPDSPAARRKAQQLASSFLAMDTDATAAAMSHGFMTALRGLEGRQTSPEQPQLSVRLRGSRIELASASEDEQVDFLGPAENIKQLFKLPYSRSGVSLAVHRVGSTLVVDGELAASELPAGFEDAPQETIKIEHQSLATADDEAADEQQSLLYEKFIYESAVRARLPLSEAATTDPPSKADGERDQRGSSEQQLQQSSRRARVKKRDPKSKKKKAKASLHSDSAAALSAGASAARSLDAVGGNDALDDDGRPDDSVSTELIASPRLHQDDGDGNSNPDFHPHTSYPLTPAQDDGDDAAAARAFAKAMKPATSGPFQGSEQPDFASSASAASAAAARSSPASYDFPTFQRVLKWKFHDLKMVGGVQSSAFV